MRPVRWFRRLLAALENANQLAAERLECERYARLCAVRVEHRHHHHSHHGQHGHGNASLPGGCE